MAVMMAVWLRPKPMLSWQKVWRGRYDCLVQELLDNFDRLTDTERMEILKRTAHLKLPPLSDKSLVLHAEELFLEMDQNPEFVAKF
jgi:hypothetical protein